MEDNDEKEEVLQSVMNENHMQSPQDAVGHMQPLSLVCMLSRNTPQAKLMSSLYILTSKLKNYILERDIGIA